MPNILQRILATKRDEVAALRRRQTLRELEANAREAPPAPGLRASLLRAGSPAALIAEVKKASPSKGLIRADFDPATIARAYERGGASALSVLTDESYFQGHLDHLRAARAAAALPVLRKDFTIDEAQVAEARASGASAILLIAAAMQATRLAELHAFARGLGLDVLVEVHDEAERDAVLAACPAIDLLGVNNRDLRTFEVDLAVTERVAAGLPRDILLVSESGIFTPADVARVVAAGARSILVGESLMRQADVEAATRALLSR